jgi:hypothetical protein
MTTVIPTLINTQMRVALAFMTYDWYNQYHYPQQKLEGYWPSYNYEADLQSSSQQDSSQYEEYETNKEDSLIEEDEDSVVYDDGFSQ